MCVLCMLRIIRFDLIFVYQLLFPGAIIEETIGALSLRFKLAEDADAFFIDFSFSICLSPGDCVLDVDVVTDQRIPKILCNPDFSLRLPGE